MLRHLLGPRDMWCAVAWWCCLVWLRLACCATASQCTPHTSWAPWRACGVICCADETCGCAVASCCCLVWLRLACCATVRACTTRTSWAACTHVAS